MSNLTKQAIRNSMLKLLKEKPVSRITVKDISEDCGINRNTFYYHYQDIPALIEEIFTSEAEKIIAEYQSLHSMEECLAVVVSSAQKHKKEILKLFHTSHRELYEQSLWRTCEYVMNCFMNAVFQDDSDLKQKDQEILVQYYKCTLFGLVMDWMSHDMQTDLQAPFQHLLELQDVIVHQILIRQNPENAQNSDKF